jgi:hypothetical protein
MVPLLTAKPIHGAILKLAEIEIDLAQVGKGLAIGMQGEILALVSPKAFAPGQPLSFRLAADHGGAEILGKSLGSKRRSDGLFDVRVRLINLHRSMRTLLVSLLGGTAR